MTEKKLEELSKERIYRYCDDNIGNKILFTGFEWLHLKYEKITPKDLVNFTGIIVRDLIGKKILREVEKEFESVYALYEILPHEKLIENIKRR